MRTIALLLLCVAVPATAEALFDGVDYKRLDRVSDGAPMVSHVVTLDLTRPGVRLAVTPADRSKGMEHVARTVSDHLVREKAQIAVNASYFLPFNGGSARAEDFYPQSGDGASVSGAAMARGRAVSPVEIDQDLRVNAILCVRAADIRIADGQRCPRGTTDAVAAGPRLLTGGTPSALPPYDFSRSGAKGPRTAVGVAADRKTAWLVVVDGRQQGYSMGASLSDLVTLFRELGATDAINMDGGGSSALVAATADGAPRVLSRPIHTGVPGRERPVANHIAVFAKPLER